MAEQEVWMNATRGRVQVRKHDARGRLGAELIGAGRRVAISTEDRVINQEMAASEELDIFLNGALQPVRLLDDADETTQIASPNHLTEDEMRSLFKAKWQVFDARVRDLSNAATLHRMLELAEEIDATVRQVKVLEERLGEVNPVEITEIQSAGRTDSLRQNAGLKPVTPR